MSHVKTSFDIPEYTTDVNALGTLRILEAIRINNLKKLGFIKPHHLKFLVTLLKNFKTKKLK